jgi:Restriction endonuclease
MNAYDFLIFSPSEFELFCKDLLESHWGVQIEAFADGADGAVDLRFKTKEDKTAIIQCKRYTSSAGVLSSLRKEVSRIKRLAPSRYIVVTAKDITDIAKQKLVRLFAFAGMREEDIIGSKDLNKILSRHPEVEDRFFKLWINSTQVLKRILKSRIYNYSEFKKNEITRLKKFYVQNNSFDEALAILKDHRYCILSGIPGIGKTTLTRILAYYLLGRGFRELIYLSHSFSDAWEFHNDKRKQLFIFDDFLGNIVTEGKLEFSEDSVLMDFIEVVRQSPNTMLILATRENVLNLAKIQYERLNDPRIELSKCIIDLGKYTSKVRALILYNHIFYSGMPQEYVDHLLKDRFYFTLLKHQNYSPRIIETLTVKEVWKTVKPNEVQQLFRKSFDNPHFVWKHAFDNQLRPVSRCFLLIMVSCGAPILVDDIQEALKVFLAGCGTNYEARYSHGSFDNALKELHNCFIITTIDSKGKIAVEFQNPSIQDFLLNQIAADLRIIHDILHNASYLNQLLCPACRKTPTYEQNAPYVTWIPALDRYEKIEKSLVEQYKSLPYYELRKLTYDNGRTYWVSSKTGPFERLKLIHLVIMEVPEEATALRALLIRDLESLANSTTNPISYFEFDAFSELLQQYGDQISIDKQEVFTLLETSLNDLSHLTALKDLEPFFPHAYQRLIEDRERLEAILDHLYKKEMVRSYPPYAFELETLKRIGEIYRIDISDIWAKLAARVPNTTIDPVKLEIRPVATEPEANEDAEQERNEIDLIFSRLVSSPELLGGEYWEAPF